MFSIFIEICHFVCRAQSGGIWRIPVDGHDTAPIGVPGSVSVPVVQTAAQAGGIVSGPAKGFVL